MDNKKSGRNFSQCTNDVHEKNLSLIYVLDTSYTTLPLPSVV